MCIIGHAPYKKLHATNYNVMPKMLRALESIVDGPKKYRRCLRSHRWRPQPKAKRKPIQRRLMVDRWAGWFATLN